MIIHQGSEASFNQKKKCNIRGASDSDSRGPGMVRIHMLGQEIIIRFCCAAEHDV